MESPTLVQLVKEMIDLLKKIEENTRPEKVDESQPQIKGFGSDK